MAISLSVPSGLQHLGGSGTVVLSGYGMLIQICPAQADTKPVIAHADNELADLQRKLVADGESPESARLIGATVSSLRKRGRFAASLVRFAGVSGVKYEFADAASTSHVVHYVLHVPGGHVTVMATAPAGRLDAALVESFLHSIAVT